MIRRYSDLILLPEYSDRLRYLKLNNKVGEETFGTERYLNQRFYTSQEWRNIRSYLIVRDNGCDLGVPGCPISGRILIHHMNPISVDDIVHATRYLMDPEYLICVSEDTHQKIHYGVRLPELSEFVERTPYDTSPWRKTQ